MESPEVMEENRKIRFLRFLVDLSIRTIQEGDLSSEEAANLVEGLREVCLRLFPGKEEAFDLIYRPRFRRVIEATFGVPPEGEPSPPR